MRATPPATGGAHPLTAIMRPTFHSLTTALPPARPPGSFRVANRKSPPERLPLYLMQHRSWLMHGPAAGPAAGAAGDVGEPCDAEQRLRRALSLRMRRWAMYEFLTPVIDRGYLAEGSMAEYLATLGLDQVPPSDPLLPPPRVFRASALLQCVRGVVAQSRTSCARSLPPGHGAALWAINLRSGRSRDRLSSLTRTCQQRPVRGSISSGRLHAVLSGRPSACAAMCASPATCHHLVSLGLARHAWRPPCPAASPPTICRARLKSQPRQAATHRHSLATLHVKAPG